MNIITYLIVSSICLSIFYVIYKLVLDHDSHFKMRRLYLMSSLLLSFLMPLNTFRIDLDLAKNQNQDGTSYKTAAFESKSSEQVVVAQKNTIDLPLVTESAFSKKDYTLLVKLYVVIALLLLIRMLFQISVMIYQFLKSERKRQGKYIFICTDYFKHVFSFFNWIFINPCDLTKEDKEQIIVHEKIHASQYHSIDLILIELISAVMWFNPFVWMMKRSIRLLHEYLADEGALSTGIDKLGYQALLINQVIEEKLICVSSNFNSLIKKRMIMITKSKSNQRTKLKIFTLVPASILLFVTIACFNGILYVSSKASTTSLKESFAIQSDNSEKPIASIQKIKELSLYQNQKNRLLKRTEIGSISTTYDFKDSIKMIYVLNGKKVESIDNLNPDSIESMNVLKEDNLMIVRTKGYKRNNVPVEIKNTKPDISKIIIFIDGKEQPENTDINSINPEQIQSINVVKSENLKAYTNKKCEGIILITTKAKK